MPNKRVAIRLTYRPPCVHGYRLTYMVTDSFTRCCDAVAHHIANVRRDFGDSAAESLRGNLVHPRKRKRKAKVDIAFLLGCANHVPFVPVPYPFDPE